MLVIGSNRIDWFFSKVFSYVTKLWCRVTRKSNVGLAFLLWGFSAGLLMSFTYVEITVMHFAYAWLSGLIRMIALFFVWARLQHVRMHIEDRSVPPGIIPMPPACLLVTCKMRGWWMVVLGINVLIPPFPTLQTLPYSLGILAGAMSQYVILNIDLGLPKKDSLWARARGWLRDHAPSWGGLAPAPSPA